MSQVSKFFRNQAQSKLNSLKQEASVLVQGAMSSEDKPRFIEDLKKEWRLHLSGTSFNIEKQADLAEKRIRSSQFAFLFKQVGITREDLVKALTEIKEETNETKNKK